MPPRKEETLFHVYNRKERKCAKCQVTKDVSCFNKDKYNPDGLYPYCKECRKSITRKRYELRKEHILHMSKMYRKTDAGKLSRNVESEKFKKKPQYKANYLLTNAVRDKRIIKPLNCSKCNIFNVKIHGHHYDYTKPLDVVWVCKDCHNHIHRTESHLIIYK